MASIQERLERARRGETPAATVSVQTMRETGAETASVRDRLSRMEADGARQAQIAKTPQAVQPRARVDNAITRAAWKGLQTGTMPISGKAADTFLTPKSTLRDTDELRAETLHRNNPAVSLPTLAKSGGVLLPTGAEHTREHAASMALERLLEEQAEHNRALSKSRRERDFTRTAELQEETKALNDRLMSAYEGAYDEGRRTAGQRFGYGMSSIAQTAGAALPVLWDTARQYISNNEQQSGDPRRAELAGQISQLVGRLDYLERYKYPTRYAARQSEEWKALDAERTKLREALAALDVNTPVSMDAPGMQMMTEAIETREKALAGTEGVPRFLGETAISIGQNLALMPTAAISPTVPLAAMGAIAAADKTYELNSRGVAPSEALARGLVSGGIEAATEKIPLDNLLDLVKTGGRSAVRSLLRQMGTEATEESVSYVLNYIADKAAKDPEAEFSLQELAASAAGGALSGGVLSGGAMLLGRAMGGNASRPAQEAPEAANSQTMGLDTPTVQQTQKNASTGEAVNENGLLAFSEQETINLSSGKRNKIITTFNGAVDFIRNALSNKQNIDRAYFGKVPETVVQRVKSDSGIDLTGFSVIMNGNDARHIMKDHGDVIMETARGQVAVTPDDIALIPRILAEPDNVYLSSDKDGKGRSVIVFEKQIGNKYITMQGVSDGKHALETDTLYIRKQKGSQDTGHNAAKGDPVINAQSVPPQSPSSAPIIADSSAGGNTQSVQAGPAVFGEKQQIYPDRLVQRAAATLGESGSRAFLAAYDAETAERISLQDAFAGFARIYNRALDGKKSTREETLPAHLTLAAEAAGKNDALRAQQAKYFGRKAGLVRDQRYRQANLSAKTARVLDTMGKTAGVEVRFAEEIVDTQTGARANAKYESGPNGGRITIALDAQDPVRTAFTHEIIHRMREVSPESYSELAQFVQKNLNAQTADIALVALGKLHDTQNIDYLTEELVADAFGQVLGDSAMLEQFVMEHRTAAERLMDAVHELLEKVRAALDHQRGREQPPLTQEERAGLRDLEKNLDSMAQALEAALVRTGQDVKKRTDQWLRDNTLRLPFSPTTYGPTSSTPSSGQNSNTKYSLMALDGEEYSVEGAEYAGAFTAEERAEAAQLWREMGTQSPYFKRFYDGNTPELYQEDGSPRAVYHGTAEEIHIFDKKKRGAFTKTEDARMGFFFSSSAKVASGYAENTFPYEILKLRDEFDRMEELLGVVPEADDLFKKVREKYEKAVKNYRASGISGVLMKVFLSMKDPVVVDFKGDAYQGNSERYTRIIQEAAQTGKDGVVFKNVYDTFGSKKFREMSDVFVVFEPEQIKAAEDNAGTFDTTDPDIRHSLMGSREMYAAVQALSDRAEREGMSDAQVKEEIAQIVDETYRGMIGEYGEIKQGERPARHIQVPQMTEKDQKVSLTARTVLEAKATPEETVPSIKELVARGEFSYEVHSDKRAIAEAESAIQDKGYATALADWSDAVGKGEVSKANTAMGWALYNAAANAGDIQSAMTVLTKMVGHQRNAAQAVQATRILKKMSPEGQLYGVQRSVQNLQEELKKEYGKDAPDLKIDPDLAKAMLLAEDQKARDEAARELFRDIGRQMPSRFVDKWNAWRYLAMLANPRTHVRNIVGNAFFAPVVAAKDMTATAIEVAVERVSGGRLNRTKGAVGLGRADRDLLAAAWGDYANVKEAALGAGKYSDFANANQYIEEGRRIFKSKSLEAVRRANSRALDAEDAWFSHPHYAYALAQYCKANHITAEQIATGKGMDKARAYAIKEAQKATYRDTNALSQTISDLGRYSGKNAVGKGVSTAMEGILPFRKTPANILARGLEYSPAGLLKGLTYDLHQVKQGELSGAEAIDRISAGMTGTGLLAFGMYCAAQALVRGAGGEDEEKKKFEELQGHQTYALELPDGTSVTLDWLAPEALPFFVGVNLWEQTQGEREPITLSAILKATRNVMEPLLEMSCLQSLNDVFDAVGYATSEGMDGLFSALASAATSYLTQGVPTLLGQFERTGQEERMTTYTEKNAFLTRDAQYTLGRISGRLPGWDYQQIPYIDAWGRTEDTGSAGKRAVDNFLNPAYTAQIETSQMEEELLRLYEATGDSGVFPARADKYFTVNGKRRELTAEEYVTYATAKGQTSYQILRKITNARWYTGLSDGDKVRLIQDAYDYANAIGKTKVSEYQPDGWIKRAISTTKRTGVPIETYLYAYEVQRDIQSLKDQNGETITNSRGLLVMEAVYSIQGLTDKQRQAMFTDFEVGKTIIQYNKALVEEKLRKLRKS